MNDPVFLLLLGGMVGIIFQKLYEAISKSVERKDIGLYFSLSLLFLANAFVLVGEILLFPPVRSQLPGLAFIFLVALTIFILAVYSLSKVENVNVSIVISSIYYIIFGNILWGVSEISELILIEFGASGDPSSFSRYIRIIFLVFAVICFLAGAYKIKKEVKNTEQLDGTDV